MLYNIPLLKRLDLTGTNLPGLTMTGPLIVKTDAITPAGPMDLISRGEVDAALTNIDISNIVTGYLSKDRYPSLIGDASYDQPTGSINLSAVSLSPGIYHKVTVDAKGRVQAGTTGGVDSSVITSFSWSKVTDRPNTLSGYGISNGQSRFSDITGNVILKGDPVDVKDAYTVGKYLTIENTLFSTESIGSLLGSWDANTPAKYLKANGSLVSKTTYADLYAIIGDRFSGKMVVGSGQPWRRQYLFNATDPGDLTWSVNSISLPSNVYIVSAVVTKNILYIISGVNSGSYGINKIYSSIINGDGTLSSWVMEANLPVVSIRPALVVTKNRIYLIGGQNGSSATNVVLTASINEDGTLGTWSTGPNLPVPIDRSDAVVTKNRVYLIGGYSGYSYLNYTYTAPINEDGTLGTWSAGPNLPEPLGATRVTVIKNIVYILGAQAKYSVYSNNINEDGTLGTWIKMNDLPKANGYSQLVTVKNRIYLLGGFSSSDVCSALINGDGTLGTWSAGSSLPGILSQSQAVVTKNRVYLLGGEGGSGYVSAIYTAPFTGGKNDYSEFYTGNLFNSDPTKFTLPDYSTNDKYNLNYYIRYE